MRRPYPQILAARIRPGARAGTFALSLSYATVGVFWGAWAVSLNEVLRAERLSPGDASIGLATFGLAALAAMALVRPRLRAVSRRGSICLALAVFAAGCSLLVVAPSPALVPGFSVAGIGAGVGDVAINAAGNELEEHVKRPVLQWVHGGYSGGAAVGALGAGIALSLAVSYRTVLLTASVLPLLPVYVVSRAAALDGFAQGRADPARGRARRFIPPPGLLLPAVVIGCGLLLEGSLGIWSALYLRRGLSASVLFAGASLAAFALSMAAGRTFAARVLFRFGYRKTISASGAGTAALGVILALTSSPYLAAAAMLALGFFLAAAAPAGYGMIGGTPESRAAGIAWVTATSYVALMAGPPIMGWSADAVGLRSTMLLLALLAAPMAAGALPGRSRLARLPAEALRRHRTMTGPAHEHTQAGISSPSTGPREDRHRPG